MIVDNQFSVKGFVVWGVSAFFFFYEFSLRTIMGTFQHSIMRDLSLSCFDFSLISSTIFLLTYGIMQIPVGLILQHIGLKRSLLIGTLVCAISSVGFAHSHGYFTLVFYRFLMGVGASFGFICLLIAVYEWMPQRHIALFIGISQFIGTVGPMVAAGPLDDFLQSTNVSWRYIFDILGAVGLVLLLAVLLLVQNKKQKSGKYVVLRRPEKVITSIGRIFFRVQPWYIAFFQWAYIYQ